MKHEICFKLCANKTKKNLNITSSQAVISQIMEKELK